MHGVQVLQYLLANLYGTPRALWVRRLPRGAYGQQVPDAEHGVDETLLVVRMPEEPGRPRAVLWQTVHVVAAQQLRRLTHGTSLAVTGAVLVQGDSALLLRGRAALGVRRQEAQRERCFYVVASRAPVKVVGIREALRIAVARAPPGSFVV